MSTDLLPEFIRTHYEVHEWKHACAILKQDFAAEWDDIVSVLTEVSLIEELDHQSGRKKVQGFAVHRRLPVPTRMDREGLPHRNGS